MQGSLQPFDANELRIEYRAQCDQATPPTTNHSYFNLNGHQAESMLITEYSCWRVIGLVLLMMGP